MTDLEIEKTYLLAYLPEELVNLEPVELMDIYIPESSFHPKLRLGKRGNVYEITKKKLKSESDMSVQIEETIPLEKYEFEALSFSSKKKIRKLRYSFKSKESKVDIDLFLDDLFGLGIADFEFESKVERDRFTAPDFVLADVTNEKFIAGGLLAGKTYEDIMPFLKKFSFKKLNYKSSL